ncbi:MAG: GDP-mannose 4,6-dehydratase [Gaiellaceae bacterium]
MSGRILVTGARGFAGSHLMRRLGERAVPAAVDVLDADAVRAAVRAERPLAVVHLAAAASVARSWNRGAEAWQGNVVGTVNLLDAVAVEAPAARVLAVSTAEVYGRAEVVPTPEDGPLAPLSPYGASKAASELACERSHRADGLAIVVTRSFPHLGPGQDERFAVGSWVLQVARAELAGGGALQVGDLTVRRDLLDVRDVARAYEALLDPGVPAGIYNVATGRARELREVVELLVELAGCTIEVERDPARLRPADIPVLCGDGSRLSETTGWSPQIPLEQSLADALDEARRAVRTAETVDV